MRTSANYKCRNCGGNIHFEPGNQLLVCESCDSTFTELELGRTENEEGEKQEYNSYECASCGAELITDKKTIATSCVYCKSPIVISDRIGTYSSPDYVLPFLIDKKAAIEEFKKFCKKERKAPRAIRAKSTLDNMESVYVPSWIVSGAPEGKIVHECVKKNAAKSGGNPIDYVYDVETMGSARFDKVPVNANNNVNEVFIESVEPFDYNKMVPFDRKYIIGHFADRTDMQWEKCFRQVKQRVEGTMASQFEVDMKEYKEIKFKEADMQYRDIEKQNTLLPVWFLDFKYKGEGYCFTINGQTGKVAGVLPMSNIVHLLFHIIYTIVLTVSMGLVGLLGGPLLSIGFAVGALIFSIKSKVGLGKKIRHAKHEENANQYMNLSSIQVLNRDRKKIRENIRYIGVE